MLFLAHPLHTEVMANIKGRDEIFSVLGLFGALYFILKYIENTRPIYLLWASLIYFLALLSKEDAITFIAVIPLTIYFFTKAPTKKILLLSACLLAAFALYFLIRISVVGFFLNNKVDMELLNNPFLYATSSQKFATILYTWGKYMLLLLFPHPLTHDYYPKQIIIVDMSNIWTILSLVFYLAIAVYAIVRFRKKDLISYCILFFAITFSISSNLFFSIGTFMNERFMFIPLLGFCLIISYIVVEKFKSWFNGNTLKAASLLVIGIILLAYSAKTISRNPAWHDDYTLFTTDVKTSSNSAKCNVSAGGTILSLAEKETDKLTKKKMIDDAIGYLKKGISIHPKYTTAWVLLGTAMYYNEDYKNSRECYEVALKADTLRKDALDNMLYCAQMSNKKGDYNEAALCYQKLIHYQPENLDLYIQLSYVYENNKQIDSSLNIMNQLLIKNPKYGPALNEMGKIYGKYINNIDKSIDYLLQAYAVSPTDASLLQNLGVVYGIKNNLAKSLEFYNKAYVLDSSNAVLCANIARTYEALKEKQKANEFSLKANRLMQKK